MYIDIFLSAYNISYGVGTPAFYSCGPFSVFSLGNDILFCWNKSGVSILTHSGQKWGCEQHFIVFITGFFFRRILCGFLMDFFFGVCWKINEYSLNLNAASVQKHHCIPQTTCGRAEVMAILSKFSYQILLVNLAPSLCSILQKRSCFKLKIEVWANLLNCRL